MAPAGGILRMRNGLYRVWSNGPQGRETGALVLKDGIVFAVDRVYAYNGTYGEEAGRLAAEVTCTRLLPDQLAVNLPDMDTIVLKAAGPTNGEIAQLEGSIDEMPGTVLSYELAFLCAV
jgi:hypothetical protein